MSRAPNASARLRIALTADPELPVPPRLYGGIERVVDLLARGLAERGHSVTLFAHRESSAPVPRVDWPGRRSDAPLDTVRNAAVLARRCLRGDFDLVHSFSRIAYLLPVLPLSLPKLMTYQRQVSPRSVHLGTMLSRGTLWFSAISRHMVRDVDSLGTWRLVFNGVALETYPCVDDPGPDAPLVFLGRIESIKGPDLAIEVARRSGRRLVIAGNVPPDHRGWFEREVLPHVDGDRIRYIGPVDDRQKASLLGAACALLMPIRWDEPFGIVMAEAMACGTPVIGLARGSVGEVVDHGLTGFVELGVDGMVEAVAALPAVSRRECRRRVERLFSEASVVDGYLEVYREMLESRGRS